MLIGVEEEVFICEQKTPNLSSLYSLTKLLWKNPRFYYKHSASNFARGKDIFQGMMSGVEVATSVHSSADSAFEELMVLRQELAAVSDGLIVPLGHLLQTSAPTNTCALQIHIGGFKDWEQVYANLVHFLPVLTLAGLNSPYAGKERFGQSFRLAKSYAIGPLTRNARYRFQDIIFARRLGTIEIRVFDPFWDPQRLKILLRTVKSIAEIKDSLPSNRGLYNQLRNRIAKNGWFEEMEPLWQKLYDYTGTEKSFFMQTPADETAALYEQFGLLKTYSALDNAYRNGVLESRPLPPVKNQAVKLLQGAAGLAGYYLPKFPYITWKYLREK